MPNFIGLCSLLFAALSSAPIYYHAHLNLSTPFFTFFQLFFRILKIGRITHKIRLPATRMPPGNFTSKRTIAPLSTQANAAQPARIPVPFRNSIAFPKSRAAKAYQLMVIPAETRISPPGPRALPVSYSGADTADAVRTPRVPWIRIAARSAVSPGHSPGNLSACFFPVSAGTRRMQSSSPVHLPGSGFSQPHSSFPRDRAYVTQ